MFKGNWKAILFRWVKLLALLYALIGIVLYYAQDYLLFHPVKVDRNIAWHFDVPFKEVDLAINDTDTLNMVQFYPRDSVRRGVVIYFHGNKENIGRYAKFADNFTSKGYEVWMEDYPGFGKSIGTLTERDLYRQAEQVYLMAASKYAADSILIYGKSFGTGIAAYLAAVKPARRLILETPYYSIPALFGSYAPIYPTTRMAHYQIPVNEFLPDVKYPITIFHGTDDGVIRYSCAAKLKTVLQAKDAFITIPDGTHHNLHDFPLYHRVLDSLLR